MFQFYCCFHGIFDLSISLNLNLNRTLNLISCLVCKQTFKNQGDRSPGWPRHWDFQRHRPGRVRKHSATVPGATIAAACRPCSSNRLHRSMFVLLVGGWPTPLKNMSSSVGMMKFPLYGNSKKIMFQTTNQVTFDGCYPKLSPWTS